MVPNSTLGAGPCDSLLHSQLTHPQSLEGQLSTDSELERNTFLLMCCPSKLA